MCVVGHGYLLPLAAHRLCCCDRPHTPAVTVGLCSKHMHTDRYRNLAKCCCRGSRHWLAWGDPTLDQPLCAEPSTVTAAQRARRCRVLGASIMQHLPGSQPTPFAPSNLATGSACQGTGRFFGFRADSAKKGAEVRFCLQCGCQGCCGEAKREGKRSEHLLPSPTCERRCCALVCEIIAWL
jgi:hypothetical protein